MASAEMVEAERWEKMMEMLDRLGDKLEAMEANQLRIKVLADRAAAAARKMEAMSLEKRMKGTLEWFNATTGSGFVTSVDHDELLYFLQPSLKSHGLTGDHNLKVGDSVEFKIMEDRNGCLKAFDITVPRDGAFAGGFDVSTSWKNKLGWAVDSSNEDAALPVTLGGMSMPVFDEMPHPCSEVVGVRPIFSEGTDYPVFGDMTLGNVVWDEEFGPEDVVNLEVKGDHTHSSCEQGVVPSVPWKLVGMSDQASIQPVYSKVDLKVARNEEMQSETHMHEGLLQQLAQGGQDLEESVSNDAHVEDEASRPYPPSGVPAVVMNGGSMEELLSASIISVFEDGPEKEQKVETVGAISASGILSQELAPDSVNEINGASQIVDDTEVDGREEEAAGHDILEVLTDDEKEVGNDSGNDDDDEGAEKGSDYIILAVLLKVAVAGSLDGHNTFVFQDGLGSSVPYLRPTAFSQPARSNLFSPSKLAATAYPTEEMTGEELEIRLVQKMAVATIGQFLAVLVLSSEQIAWNGIDSVSICWPEVLLMIGPNGDPVQYNYDEPTKLIPECDGVRILSNSSMEFLHRVSDFTTSFVGIGSISSATLLYDVRDHYDRQSKGSVRYGITELRQWWLNVFSLGNSGMAVQSQLDIQRKSMNKLRGLQFRMVYDKGKENTEADAFSQVGSFMARYGVIAVQPVGIQEIPNPSVTVSYAQDLLQRLAIHKPDEAGFLVPQDLLTRLLASSPDEQGFRLHQGLIYKYGQLLIGCNTAIHTKLMAALHDRTIGGHSGVPTTYKKVNRVFGWTGLKANVIQFVKQCLTCQQAKSERVHPAGILQSLLISKGAWEDLMAALLRFSGYEVQTVHNWLAERAAYTAFLREQMAAAPNHMKRFADRQRTARKFPVGDLLFLKLQPCAHKSLDNRPCPKSVFKFFRPYKVMAGIRAVDYRLALAEDALIHPVFHPKYTPVFVDLPRLTDFAQGDVVPVEIMDRSLVCKASFLKPSLGDKRVMVAGDMSGPALGSAKDDGEEQADDQVMAGAGH